MSRRRSLDHLNRLPITLGSDQVYVGTLAGQNDYVVHGQVQGDSDIDGALLIGAAGVWVGNIKADTVVVKGRIHGNVDARFKIELRPGARIHGDISGPVIAIADGAVVEGQISPDSAVIRFSERRTH